MPSRAKHAQRLPNYVERYSPAALEFSTNIARRGGVARFANSIFMSAPLLQQKEKRVATVMQHASGDKRFKILEVHMKKHQFRHDALIEVLHKAQELFGFLE